jgi:hypothetical protein
MVSPGRNYENHNEPVMVGTRYPVEASYNNIQSTYIPLIGDHRSIAMLEGQFHWVLRVMQVVEEQSLVPHQYTHLHKNNFHVICITVRHNLLY